MVSIGGGSGLKVTWVYSRSVGCLLLTPSHVNDNLFSYFSFYSDDTVTHFWRPWLSAVIMNDGKRLKVKYMNNRSEMNILSNSPRFNGNLL